MMKKLSRLSKLLLIELTEVLAFPILYVPGATGNILRRLYWKRRLNFLGKDSIIDVGVQIINPRWISIDSNTHVDRFVILVAGPLREGNRVICRKDNSNFVGKPGELIIGSRVHIAPYTLINAHGGVRIGNDSAVAAGTKIFSVSNHYRNLNDDGDLTPFSFCNQVSDDQQCIIIGPVVMKTGSGLGINSVILPGSSIGENSWVGLRSYVVGEIPPNVVAVGCPAKIIRDRSRK